MSERRSARRDRIRPVELIGAAAVLGVFVGAVVFMGSREIVVALEFAGVAFIVSLVVLAMLLLAATPKSERHRDDEEPPGGH